MQRFFNADNPVWRFIGNIADMFFLSVLWYASALLIVPAGAGTTALNYAALRLASNQEGEDFASFKKSFLLNFKQATVLWLIFLAGALVLAADWFWCLFSGAALAQMLFPALVIISVLYVNWMCCTFPLLARCENTTKRILWLGFTLSLRHFLPVLSATILTAGVFALGLFVTWPLLLIAPGLSAYINAYIYNHIFEQYGIDLRDDDPA